MPTTAKPTSLMVHSYLSQFTLVLIVSILTAMVAIAIVSVSCEITSGNDLGHFSVDIRCHFRER